MKNAWNYCANKWLAPESDTFEFSILLDVFESEIVNSHIVPARTVGRG